MQYKDWLNEWLNTCIKPTVKEHTIAMYERTVRLHILPKLGECGINELSAQVLQTFIAEQTETYSGNTVKGVIAILKSSLDAAKRMGVIDHHHADKIVKPKTKEKQIECFSIAEQKTLENYILRSGKDKLFGIVLCLYTGLRIGELLALKWEDIDFSSGLLFVNKTCYDTWQSGKYVKKFDEPKTANSRRVIPLPKQIVSRLKELKKRSKSDMIIGEGDNEISIRSYQRTFDLLLKKLNIPHKGFHALRHTFATRALECGMDVKTLSEILGHKNPTITLSRYAHSMMDYKVSMMNKLGKLLD